MPTAHDCAMQDGHAGQQGDADAMGAGFKVEISELDGLVRELHRSQDEMRAALTALRDTGPKTTGSKELDNACDEFHDSWDDAITKIAEGTQAIEDGLKKTRDTYRDVETALRDGFAGKGGTQ
ncbi:WXG100 family type VII secretion target [Streptomyces bluensis]|uniref:WXG100 family type VII secretion target n=1 Tax=Streptomyces bluensis TaxID=33897 RepID=UPI00331733BC